MLLNKDKMSAAEIPFNFIIGLIDGVDPEGQRVFHYLAVKEDLLDNLAKAMRLGKPYDLQDYGVIIESGYDEPNQELREKMEKLYNCNHNSIFKISANAN